MDPEEEAELADLSEFMEDLEFEKELAHMVQEFTTSIEDTISEAKALSILCCLRVYFILFEVYSILF